MALESELRTAGRSAVPRAHRPSCRGHTGRRLAEAFHDLSGAQKPSCSADTLVSSTSSRLTIAEPSGD